MSQANQTHMMMETRVFTVTVSGVKSSVFKLHLKVSQQNDSYATMSYRRSNT